MEPHFAQVGIIISLNTSHHNNSQHNSSGDLFYGERDDFSNVCTQSAAAGSFICCFPAVCMYVCMYVYVAVTRQDSMSPVRANAVLSEYCNIFVGYP